MKTQRKTPCWLAMMALPSPSSCCLNITGSGSSPSAHQGHHPAHPRDHGAIFAGPWPEEFWAAYFGLAPSEQHHDPGAAVLCLFPVIAASTGRGGALKSLWMYWAAGFSLAWCPAGCGSP